MQAQLKQKKMQFQRLDHCVQTKKENGDIVEISGRCGDTNNTITSILGMFIMAKKCMVIFYQLLLCNTNFLLEYVVLLLFKPYIIK